VLKGTQFLSKKLWKQKRRCSSTTLQIMACRIALNIGSIVCSCVSLGRKLFLRRS
jgi:hypothetical protein